MKACRYCQKQIKNNDICSCEKVEQVEKKLRSKAIIHTIITMLFLSSFLFVLFNDRITRWYMKEKGCMEVSYRIGLYLCKDGKLHGKMKEQYGVRPL